MREEINPNSNQYLSSCGYAGQLVSFLYEEISGAEKKRFETHLLNCDHCAEEIADFSAVRRSIQDWREADFAVLAAPAFKMPAQRDESSSLSRRLKSFRDYLSFSPVWLSSAAAGVASILLVGGFFWFLSGSPENNEIAANLKEPLNKIVSSSETQISRPNPIGEVAGTSETKEQSIEKSQTAPVAKNEQVGKNTVSPAKIGESKTANNSRQAARARKESPAQESGGEQNNKTTVKIAPPQSQKRKTGVPSLAIDEDDRDSLRLSDLLDEVSLK